MAKISDERKAERAARIQRRAQNYINGDIDLDTFIMLEQLDNEDEADIVEALAKEREKKEAEIEQAERRKEADKLRDLIAQDEAETEEKPAPKKAAPKRPAPYPPELDYMTAEEYRKLSIAEMTRLYEAAPDKVREILDKNDRPAYMDIIYPKEKPRDFKGITPEDFKKMHLNDLQELYNTDPALYNQLREAAHGNTYPTTSSETTAVILDAE